MSRTKTDNKKKPARVAAGPEAPGFARTMGENTGRVLRAVFPLVVFLLTGTLVSAILWTIADARRASNTRTQAGTLLTPAIRQAVLGKQRPMWIPREDFEQVANLGLVAQNRSVFQPHLSRALAASYEKSSWVERVREIRLRYPGQLQVELDWRRPVAKVDHSSMVLDAQGVVLNLMSDNPVVKNIPTIAGVLSTRTEAGRPVSERELVDGLNLLATVREALRQSPGNLRVTEIMREPSGTWRVSTDRGPAIYWGSFTDDPPMDEPQTREKADLLRRRLCEAKDPGLLEYVKVYHPSAPVKPRIAPPVSGTPGNTAVSSGRSNVSRPVPMNGTARRP